MRSADELKQMEISPEGRALGRPKEKRERLRNDEPLISALLRWMRMTIAVDGMRPLFDQSFRVRGTRGVSVER